MGVGKFYSTSRWTISTTSHYLVFFLFKKSSRISSTYLHIFTRDAPKLFERSVSKDSKQCTNCGRISPFTKTQWRC